MRRNLGDDNGCIGVLCERREMKGKVVRGNERAHKCEEVSSKRRIQSSGIICKYQNFGSCEMVKKRLKWGVSKKMTPSPTPLDIVPVVGIRVKV